MCQQDFLQKLREQMWGINTSDKKHNQQKTQQPSEEAFCHNMFIWGNRLISTADQSPSFTPTSPTENLEWMPWLSW